jgi:hypothetical protein
MTGHSKWRTTRHRGEVPSLTSERLQQMHDDWEAWITKPPPCGISYDNPFNPCLPEWHGKSLMCMNPGCGLRQEDSAP